MNRMLIVRCCLLLLMLTALLPWGAYSARFVSGDPAVLTLETADEAERVSPATRKCRTANLPGSPCGPDLVEPSGIAASHAPAIIRTVYGRGAWSAVERVQRPPTGPPRLS